MAKLSFNKLGLKPNNEIKTIEFNEQIVEVKQYLSTEDKLEIVTNVLQLSHDQNGFSNPTKVSVYTALEILRKYTNITFTEKQKEDVLKLYDLINGNGLLKEIIKTIPEVEYNELITTINTTIESVYKFQNSVLGILESISKDYGNLNFDMDNIQKTLGDSENLTFLKDVVTKLG